MGWTHSDGKDFYVRQLRDAKITPKIDLMEYDDLVSYAFSCGWALARAHARTADPAVISGYIGKGKCFQNAVAKFASFYCGQNQKDYQKFAEAIGKSSA